MLSYSRVYFNITTSTHKIYLSIASRWNQRKIVALHLVFFVLSFLSCVKLDKPCLSGKNYSVFLSTPRQMSFRETFTKFHRKKNNFWGLKTRIEKWGCFFFVRSFFLSPKNCVCLFQLLTHLIDWLPRQFVSILFESNVLFQWMFDKN